MAVKRDYYEVLGVGRDAGEDEIRRAFRKLARQYHPDVSKEAGADARFKEINEAYEVLSSSEKRQSYDRFGHDGAQAGFGRAGAGFGIDEIFETFFGGTTRGGRRPTRGADLRYDLQIDFAEAVFGTSREIEVPRIVPCGRCSGNGAEPGSEPERCPRCNGAGEIRRVQQSVFGQFVNVMACDRCRGAGQVISKPCAECAGRGERQVSRTLKVDIPAGVDQNQQVRLLGEGELGGRGGPPGDLYVVFNVSEHPTFKRHGTDILYELTVNVAQAALGVEIDVPTIEGAERVKIPSGTQNGRVIRLRGKGVPHLNSHARGDQQVRVRVAIPQLLTAEQRELFERLASTLEGGAEPVASKSGKRLFDRVKDVLGGE